MKNIKLSLRIISKIFWEIILTEDQFVNSEEKRKLFDNLISLENLRDEADYNTGSISMSQAYLLYLFLKYFKPIKVIEIGTFIGRSTISMANAIETYSDNGKIYTCDFSNDIKLPWNGKCKIKQFPKTKSGEMLNNLKGEYDLVFIDGRISDEELSTFERLINQNTIIILDDFEGIEKGVVNLAKLRQINKLNQHLLINTISEDLLKQYNLHNHSRMGALIPMTLFQFKL